MRESGIDPDTVIIIQDPVFLRRMKATFELQDRRFVYVVNDSNKVVSTPITVNPNTDGKNFVVTSGLQPGQRIAVEGVGTKLSDGMTITPTDAAAAATAAATPADSTARK